MRGKELLTDENFAPAEIPPTGGAPAASREAAWLAYFRRNAASPDPVPWARGAEIGDAERAAVGRAIAVFQRGESSDGSTFYCLAKERGAREGDPALAAATRLFIAEEQRHARDLLRFMTLAGVAPLAGTWSDGIFRRLRHVGGLEGMTAVLVTAEIIAQVFYPALRRATGSAVLRALCLRIERDEDAHVRFQCERLARLREGRSRAGRLATAAGTRLLFMAAAGVVWLEHRAVFRAAGLTVRSYASECRARLRSALAILERRAPGARAAIEPGAPDRVLLES